MGSVDHPSVTGRESFREVFIKDDLRKAIARINLRDGEPWLDDGRISQAVSALERIGQKKLIEANQEATALRSRTPTAQTPFQARSGRGRCEPIGPSQP